MAFKKKNVSLTTTSADVSTTVALGAAYGRVHAFDILSTGTDTAIRLKLTDADAKVFYLDAADKDYDTARIHTVISDDDTRTGLTYTPRDATGAAVTATFTQPVPVVKSPITVSIINGGTVTDTVDVNLYVEI